MCMPQKFLRILLFIFLFANYIENGYAQSTLKVSGYAPQFAEGTEIYFLPSYTNRYLQKQELERKAIKEKPSIIVSNGRFQSTIQVRNGETYTLYANGVKGSKKLCLAEGSLNINIPGINLNEVIISDNETAIAYERFYQDYFGSDLYKAAAKARMEIKTSKDPNVISQSEKLLDSNGTAFKRNVAEYFKKNPNSYINASLLYSSGFSEQQKKELFNGFPKRLTENSYGDNLRFDIDSLFIGGYAPLFTQNDTLGNAVKLEKFRGKYVLIDFWASWCIPCRAENPSLVSAMKTYGTKNFTIISVSLDDNKKAWVEAIKSDGLDWTHVSDLRKRFENEVSVRYGVYAIPANFLLDPSGKIIAKNLGGKELLEVLKNL